MLCNVRPVCGLSVLHLWQQLCELLGSSLLGLEQCQQTVCMQAVSMATMIRLLQ